MSKTNEFRRWKGEGIDGGYAPFRWAQEDAVVWPWRLNEKVELEEPLCFKFTEVKDPQMFDDFVKGKVSAHLEMCIKPIGHNDGEHEPTGNLIWINAPYMFVHGMVFEVEGSRWPEETKRNADHVAPLLRFVPTWRYKVREEDLAVVHVYSLVDETTGQPMALWD